MTTPTDPRRLALFEAIDKLVPSGLASDSANDEEKSRAWMRRQGVVQEIPFWIADVARGDVLSNHQAETIAKRWRLSKAESAKVCEIARLLNDHASMIRETYPAAQKFDDYTRGFGDGARGHYGEGGGGSGPYQARGVADGRAALKAAQQAYAAEIGYEIPPPPTSMWADQPLKTAVDEGSDR